MKSGKKVNRIVSHFCFKSIVVSYSYNGAGLRYGKTVNGVTTRHVWDGANITADITGAEKTFYARGTGLIFSEANGQKQYYAFNGHGDTVSVTDVQGTCSRDMITTPLEMRKAPHKLYPIRSDTAGNIMM